MLVVKALLLLIVAVVANNFGNRVPVTLSTGFCYTFQEGQTDQSATTTSTGVAGMGSISLSTSPSNWWSWSAQQQGLHFISQTVPGSSMYSAGISQNTMMGSSFWNSFYQRATSPNDTTYTIEMWVKWDNQYSEGGDAAIIAALADYAGWLGVADSPQCNVNTGRGNLLRLLQLPSASVLPNTVDFLSYQVSTGGAPTCYDPSSDLSGQPDLTAAATYVTIRKVPTSPLGAKNSYIFNARSTAGSFTTTVQTSINQLTQPFDWRNAKLHLLHGFANQMTFAGSVYMLGMYTRALTDPEITQNYNAGPPNSVPYNKIQEFVEGFQEYPFTFSLNMTDADSDTLTFVITQKPQYGRLYGGSTNSSALLITSVPYTISGNGRAVTFQGDYLGYGFPYTSFQYKAMDNVGESQIVTVNVNINRVNKPPFAYNSVQYVRSSSYSVVYLNGSDLDNSMGALRPKYLSKSSSNVAAVYQYPGMEPTACLPGCSLGSALNSGDFVTDSKYRVVVQMAPICANSGQAIVGTESIHFVFVDGEGGQTPDPPGGTATLRVLNHLEALTETFYGVMDTPATFTLHVRDWSQQPPTTNVNNEVFINRLPSHGVASAAGVNLTSAPSAVLPSYTFGFKTFLFWAGNDTLNFTARSTVASPCGSTWKSASAVATLNMRPQLYDPGFDDGINYNTPIPMESGKTVNWRIGIIEHAEPYLSPNDLYVILIEPLSDIGLLTISSDQRAQDVANEFGDKQTSGFLDQAGKGTGDRFVKAIFPLYIIRALYCGGDASDPHDLPTATSNLGYVNPDAQWSFTICFFSKATFSAGAQVKCPANAANINVTFSVFANEGETGGSALPIPALVFAWIGIGLVAILCYGCLAWRWWKNRKLQQRTRTNMAAGANASKYLHSL